MPDFWYRALTERGAVEEGVITAQTEQLVEEQLRKKGAFLIQSRPQTKHKQHTDGVIDRKELLAFLEYLSGSFAAGVPLLTTLDDVAGRLKSPTMKAIITEVRDAIANEGKSLSEAMSLHPKAFPTLFVSTIEAGEASGQLAFSLRQLVDYLDWQETISAQLRQALMYPVIVLVAVGLLVTGLIGFVFPRIIPVLRTRGGELPLPTRVIMAMSLFLRGHWLLMLVLVGLLIAAFIIARRTDRGRWWIDSAILKMPVFGPLLLDVNMARTVTYLGLFYRSGVDLLSALRLVAQMASNRVIAKAVDDARVLIESGTTLTAAFSKSAIVPMIVLRSLSLGETTGKLDEALERARLFYTREIPASVRRMITLIQPALIIVLGGVILTVALAIVLPILNIYNTIGGVRR